jgi:chaperone modulatory protein CbpM
VNIESSTALFLDEAGAVSFAQLVEQSGLTEAELQVLVDCGALEPRDVAAVSWSFSSRCIVTARAARRVRDDFALDDAHAVAVVVRFMQRIEDLERTLHALQARR